MSPYDIAQLQLQISQLKERVSRLERRESLIVNAIDHVGSTRLRDELEKREP